jgi:penicillin amidase
VDTAPGGEVRIVRDKYGTPHVYSESIYGLYYGYGYAIAQDRLFQMEMARRSTQGTVAEVLGPEYLDYDRTVRRHFDPESIRSQLAGMSGNDKDVFDGYAAGMNAWQAEIRQSPQQHTPLQFIELGFQPRDWTAYDVAMIFIGTMNNRFGDFNTELENQAILGALIGQHGEDDGRSLFDLLNPRFTDDAPTTIPRADWDRQAPDSMAATAGDRSFPIRLASVPRSHVATGFSNCYVLGEEKVEGASAILVNGPQFGWFNPSYVYSIGMHGAGIDVVGNSPFGYPMVMFGHNDTISWGSTWGASDIVDIYAERLDPEDPGKYLYRGEYRDLRRRMERIAVRGGADVEYEVYRSVHGPIVHTDPDAGYAYAKNRTWDGRELETLLAWLYATWAGDFDEWKAQAEVSAINVNMYYADVDGNIGYFHGGRFPQRTAGHDNRFPVTGDGSMDWAGRQPVDAANPHVLNPVSGYLANWNNKPGHGVMNPDFFFYSWSTADRVDFLHQQLQAKARFTADEAWAVIESSSHADVFAPYFLPLIDAAAAQSGDEGLREANRILQAWNRQSRDADADGYYDEAATAIFRTFVSYVVERVLEDDLGAAYPYFSSTGYPAAGQPTGSGTNLSTGVKAAVEALEGRAAFDLLNGESAEAIVAAALADALADLSEQQGPAPGDFRLPVADRPFATKNFLGIPQAGEAEIMTAPLEQNRGTENNMIVMKRGAIEGYEVTPPGQSGFIDRSGRKSAHYDDQFEMYYRFGRKRMWFYADDVAAHRQSETRLTFRKADR